jgi:NTP pyrophosphatase (non-canonical NTP hydrolase)
MTIEEMLEEWHRSVGDGDGVTSPGFETKELRKTLITEEYDESIEAIDFEDRVKISKELSDLVYVVFGTARAYSIPLEECIAAVHASNMTKLSPGMERREDGKILKGNDFQPAEPTIEHILSAHDNLVALGGR